MANGLFNLKQQLQGLIQKAWAGPQTTPAVEYLVVAGGGGGAGSNAGGGGYGGGGAGGLLQGISPIISGTPITITIGTGGAGGPATGGGDGTNGVNSVFGSVTAIGGGGGNRSTSAIFNGGSGGGAGSTSQQYQNYSQGVAGQGNSGGQGSNNPSYNGGGGGGAGTVGLSGGTGGGGNGGAGIASSISGTVTTYAGGGGGGGYSGNQGVGGVGGGATSAFNANGNSGTVNTGGGGGSIGSTTTAGTGGAGGSGIVIISYPDIYNAPSAFGGANSPTASTSGSGSIYNAGAGTVQFTGTATPFTFTGDFTIEGWYNLANFNNASGGGNPALISSGSTGNWLIAIPGATYVFYSGGSLVYQTAAVASANTWNHFAVVRSGTTVTIYHNGTSVGTATLSGTVTGASTTTITANGTGGVGSITGYMSNVRIVKGTAVYTTNFTPSTSPLTAITNTQLLMNSVSGGYLVDGSTNAFAPTSSTTSLAWNQASPFATGLGYKNRVYTWTGSGTVTF
jgi:hypothetical protein